MINRREFLGLAIGAARMPLFAQGSPVAATKIADGFFLITGAGCNVPAAITPDGIVMVDGGLADRSAELLKVVAEQTGGRPVKLLFNTHWHPENTGSNEALKRAGAKIVAHENTNLWLGTEVDVAWQKRTYLPRPKEALPTEMFYTNGKTTFGGLAIEYGYLMQAHTDGDIYVFFPGANLLMAGDTVSGGGYPILDYTTGGWIGGMIDAQKALLKIANTDTKIIPGQGSVLTRTELQAQSETLATIKDRIVKLLKQGLTPREIIAAAPTKEFDAKWGDPEQFILNTYQGLWGHVRELGGIV